MGKRKVRKQAIQEAELFLRVVTKDNQMLSSCFQADSSRPGLELWDMTKLLCVADTADRHSKHGRWSFVFAGAYSVPRGDAKAKS